MSQVQVLIVDQRVQHLSAQLEQEAREVFNVRGDRLRALAFTFFCAQKVLSLSDDEAFDCLTDGGQDFAVDALHIQPPHDGEFVVSMFQGKYRSKLDGEGAFPGNALRDLAHSVRYLFNPNAHLPDLNLRLRAKVEEIRSLIAQGEIPRVHIYACNNGKRWMEHEDAHIARAQEEWGDAVRWFHVNHELLVQLMQASRPVDVQLQTTGTALVEVMNHTRVFVGRVAIEEIQRLMGAYGERLLDRNVRHFLGVDNRVNEHIHETLMREEREHFYFYNNGITFTCAQFTHNAFQTLNHVVPLKKAQIINGGQTCMTIWAAADDPRAAAVAHIPAHVLVRIYELPEDDEQLIEQITLATNSQNPVELHDLRANDDVQRRLELDLSQLGYRYRRKRSKNGGIGEVAEISSRTAAVAVLSAWRGRPHQAKFRSAEHFTTLYTLIFSPSLNGAQVIVAVLLYRLADRHRRSAAEGQAIRIYGVCFATMLMAREVLNLLGLVRVEQLTHRELSQATELIEREGEALYARALSALETALATLYQTEETLSLQRLSATFRRADMIELLDGAQPTG